MTDRGTVVTRTSADAKVVAALQGHAAEVTELVGEYTFHFAIVHQFEQACRKRDRRMAWVSARRERVRRADGCGR